MKGGGAFNGDHVVGRQRPAHHQEYRLDTFEDCVVKVRQAYIANIGGI
jgi:hypothetical protein